MANDENRNFVDISEEEDNIRIVSEHLRRLKQVLKDASTVVEQGKALRRESGRVTQHGTRNLCQTWSAVA